MITDLAHGAIDVGIIHHEDIRIRHIEFDARYAFHVHHVGKLTERCIGDIRQDGVETVVHTALWFGSSQAPVKGRFGRLTFELKGKVDDGRGAAKGRRHSATLKRIAGFNAVAHGRFHVHVRIDTAGHDQ